MLHDQVIRQIHAAERTSFDAVFSASHDPGYSPSSPLMRCGLLKITAAALLLVGNITAAWGQATLHAQIFSSAEWRDFRTAVMTNYVRPTTESQLQAPCWHAVASDSLENLDAALAICARAALQALDTNSAYFTPEERQRMAAGPSGFVGIGLEMRQAASRNGDIEIVSTIQGSAAERAGLLPGDLIFSIADRPTRSMPMMNAVQSMRGEAGSILDLQVRRPGVEEPMRFSVLRAQIRLRSVRASLIAPGVLWLRLSQLRDETRREIMAEVASLYRQSPQPPAQVILDLRDCPGGLLDALVGVAALWTPEGTPVLRTIEQAGPPGRLYRATLADYSKSGTGAESDPPDGSLHKLPITLLVNQRTGAGAEALAQAMREKRQAKVFGQTTFGLAAIDKMLPLPSGAAFRIQIARMESPEGVSWESRGIVPDVPVAAQTATGWEYGALPGDTELAAVLAAVLDGGGGLPR